MTGQDQPEAPSNSGLDVRLPPEVAKRVTPTTRSKKTNDVLALPPGLNGTTSAGRRWKDLVAAYQEQLGARMQREGVRALVSSLVSLTLINERLNAEVARGEPVDPNHVIQVSQTISKLLSELGLNAKPEPRDATPAPLDYAQAFDQRKAGAK